MNLKYYVSPYDLFEDGTGAPVILHENNGRSALAGVDYYCLEERRKQNSNSLAHLCCHPVIQENYRLTLRGHRFKKPMCKYWLSWPSSRTSRLFWSLSWTATKGDSLQTEPFPLGWISSLTWDSFYCGNTCVSAILLEDYFSCMYMEICLSQKWQNQAPIKIGAGLGEEEGEIVQNHYL